ncbi:DUF982 domain-containing protein [Rhizobium sp. ZPR3]|uniref:DUF982 domain-containing protein n=2 Tax=unclassified Rhizobium TaxID=2613769 RepID=A0AAU7SPF1_9HYPH
MHNVIDVEFKMLWSMPVCLATSSRDNCLIQGPEDAIHFLSRRWPCERSTSYARATERCIAAVSHKIPVEASRAAFVIACLDARLMPGRRPS